MVKLDHQMNSELTHATELQKEFHHFKEEVEVIGDPEEWLIFLKNKLQSVSNEFEYIDRQLAEVSPPVPTTAV